MNLPMTPALAHTGPEMAGYLVTLLFGQEVQMMIEAAGFGLFAAAYVALILLMARVVGFNRLGDE